MTVDCVAVMLIQRPLSHPCALQSKPKNTRRARTFTRSCVLLFALTNKLIIIDYTCGGLDCHIVQAGCTRMPRECEVYNFLARYLLDVIRL